VLGFVCLTRRTAASVDHFGHGTLSIGAYTGSPLARTRQLVEAFCESGIDARLVDDLETERPSTLVDGLCGRELEIEAMWGEPLRRAKTIGLSLPHLERLYERLRQLQSPSSKTSGALPVPEGADRTSVA